MENGVGMEKSFPTWRFPIPTPLNLLGDWVGNRGKIFNEMGNGVGLPTRYPTLLTSLSTHLTFICFLRTFQLVVESEF